MKKFTPLLISIFLHAVIMFIVVNAPQEKKPEEPQVIVQLVELEIPEEREIVFENDVKETEKPKDSKRFGQKNVKVEKETLAQKAAEFVRQSKKKQSKSKNKSKKRKIKLSDLKPKSYLEDMLNRLEKIEQKEFEEEYGDGNLVNFSNFNDKIENGPITALNTEEFVYFSFYKRLRDRLEPSWQMMVRQAGHVLHKTSHIKIKSEILIKVNKKGEIIDSKIVKRSGNDYADFIAEEAMTQLRILNNPPEGIFGGKKYLYIKYGFIIYPN